MSSPNCKIQDIKTHANTLTGLIEKYATTERYTPMTEIKGALVIIANINDPNSFWNSDAFKKSKEEQLKTSVKLVQERITTYITDAPKDIQECFENILAALGSSEEVKQLKPS
jgi:hypothetical protein